MTDKKTDRAEQILRKMKSHGRKAYKPYDRSPDIDFLIQETTTGTGERVLDEFNQSTLDKVGEFTTASVII